MSGEISYDSDLLNDVSLVKDLISDWLVNYSQSSPGTLAFTISGQSVATGSIKDTLRLMGQVDANASDSYGSTSLIKQRLRIQVQGKYRSSPTLVYWLMHTVAIPQEMDLTLSMLPGFKEWWWVLTLVSMPLMTSTLS